MKRHIFLVVMLIAVLLASGCGTELKEGTVVCAQWQDGGWYLATITGSEGNNYNVDYADGDKGQVTREQIKLIPENPSVKVGDRVSGVWAVARFYDGSVDAVQDDGIIVRWDDGSDPSFVAYGQFIKLEGSSQAAPVQPQSTPSTTEVSDGDVPAGTVACIEWQGGSWYLGTVTGKVDDKYNVDYADGDKGQVARSGIRLIDPKPAVNTGDKVFAAWKDYRFYPGTVGEVKDNGVIVKWDDGDEPLLVEFGHFIVTE